MIMDEGLWIMDYNLVANNYQFSTINCADNYQLFLPAMMFQ